MTREIDPSILNRTGARSVRDIPSHIVLLLNQGKISSVNLMEWLATDQVALAAYVLPTLGYETLLPSLKYKASIQKKQTAKQLTEVIALSLLEQIEEMDEQERLIELLSLHESDSVRCWGAYLVGFTPHYSLERRLQRMSLFAKDCHFGVREIAWLAVRNEIINQLPEALLILSQWAKHPNENIRRFASEATRPRGVWCTHIKTLKKTPDLALPVLEPLKSDVSNYVRDSVGNWLNDAAKDHPNWVERLCQRWQMQSNSEETAYIVKRGSRSL